MQLLMYRIFPSSELSVFFLGARFTDVLRFIFLNFPHPAGAVPGGRPRPHGRSGLPVVGASQLRHSGGLLLLPLHLHLPQGVAEAWRGEGKGGRDAAQGQARRLQRAADGFVG